MSNSPIVRARLDNGLRVLTEQMTEVRSVSIGVWLARGSRHETAERSRDKTQRVSCKRQQCSHHGIEGGEEQLVEDQGRGRVVEKEVVPLDGGADGGRDHGAQAVATVLVVGRVMGGVRHGRECSVDRHETSHRPSRGLC